MENIVARLNLNVLDLTGGTQPRVEIDQSVVAEYAEAYDDGADLPPVVVFRDESNHYWLADGFHRVEALRALAYETVQAEIHAGSRREAVLYSVGANATHGLRRSNADKRRAIETLLRDEEWVLWSNSEIARKCGVSDKTVSVVRGELEASSEIPKITERTYLRDGQEVTVDTTNIGQNQPSAQTEEPAVTPPSTPDSDAPTDSPDQSTPETGAGQGSSGEDLPLPPAWVTRYQAVARRTSSGFLSMFHHSPIYGALGEPADVLFDIFQAAFEDRPGWAYDTRDLRGDGDLLPVLIVDENQLPGHLWRDVVSDAGYNLELVHLGNQSDAIDTLARDVLAEPEADDTETTNVPDSIIDLTFPLGMKGRPWHRRYESMTRYNDDGETILLARAGRYHLAVGIHAQRLEDLARLNPWGDDPAQFLYFSHSFADGQVTNVSVVAHFEDPAWLADVQARYEVRRYDEIEDARAFCELMLPSASTPARPEIGHEPDITPATGEGPAALLATLSAFHQAVDTYLRGLHTVKPGDPYTAAIIDYLVSTPIYTNFGKYVDAVKAIEAGGDALRAQLQAVDDVHSPKRRELLRGAIHDFVKASWAQADAESEAA